MVVLTTLLNVKRFPQTKNFFIWSDVQTAKFFFIMKPLTNVVRSILLQQQTPGVACSVGLIAHEIVCWTIASSASLGLSATGARVATYGTNSYDVSLETSTAGA